MANLLLIIITLFNFSNFEFEKKVWTGFEHLEPIDKIENIFIIYEVAWKAKVSKRIVYRTIKAESDGKEDAIRYCTVWSVEKSWKCINETNAYNFFEKKKRVKKSIWKNRLDVGLFGLRDAPTWSWRRYHNKYYKKVPELCFLDKHCSKKVAIVAIKEFKKIAKRKKVVCKYPKYIKEMQWVGLWNGCRSYRKRVYEIYY